MSNAATATTPKFRTAGPDTMKAERFDIYDSSGVNRIYKAAMFDGKLFHWGRSGGHIAAADAVLSRFIVAPTTVAKDDWVGN